MKKITGIYKDNKTNTFYISVKVKDENGKFRTITKRGYPNKTSAIADRYKLTAKDINKPVVKHITTINEVSDDWLESEKTKVRETTYIQKKRNIEKYIISKFDGLDIKDVVKQENLKQWRDDIISLKITNKHTNKMILMLSSIIERAYRNGYINQQEFGKSQLILENLSENNDIKKEKSYWTKDEFDKFIETFDKNDRWYVFFFTLYYTGMRFGEISGLYWKNFNEERGTIKVDHQATNKVNKGSWIITAPKTKNANREILLTHDNINLLVEMKNALNPKPNDFIFFGDKPTSQTNTSRVKDAHIKKAEVKRISLHEFRHSHASLLINNGADIVLVSKRLGHANISETLDTYTHMFPNKQIEIISKL